MADRLSPSTHDLGDRAAAACERRGLALSRDEQLTFAASISELAAALGALTDASPAATFEDRRGRPAEGNGWASRQRLAGRRRGPLADLRFAAKDNILVAGMPCALGSDARPALIPSHTAPAVQRCLDHGATLLGKAQCEDFCQASQSFTSRPQPVLNPVSPGRSAGGSSSGSAALVAAGEVDFALGTDSGGSVRLPASYCGVVGLKPTFGAVPFEGVVPLEPTLEHLGPITRTLALNERVFQTLSARRGRAPRAGLDRPLRIGLLHEARHSATLDPAIASLLDRCAAHAQAAGAEVMPVSVPAHAEAGVLHLALYTFGIAHTVQQHGLHIGATTAPGLDVIDAMARWTADPARQPNELRLLLAGADLLRDAVGERAYAAAQVARPALRAAYDAALRTADVLLLPTSEQLPPPCTQAAPGSLARMLDALGGTEHTAPFNVTGHPALSVPIGTVGDAPVGAMLVARHHDEPVLYRAARLCALPSAL